jgi:hypothetical protein
MLNESFSDREFLLKATCRRGVGLRKALMKNPIFAKAFDDAKARICRTELRFVEEADPLPQGLLAIHVAVVLHTPYNDFDTH